MGNFLRNLAKKKKKKWCASLKPLALSAGGNKSHPPHAWNPCYVASAWQNFSKDQAKQPCMHASQKMAWLWILISKRKTASADSHGHKREARGQVKVFLSSTLSRFMLASGMRTNHCNVGHVLSSPADIFCNTAIACPAVAEARANY